MENWFTRFGVSASLAKDFAWIVSCAYENAYYGYGLGELFNSNATVRDLVDHYGMDKIKPVIIAVGRIGWAKCAEDLDYEKECREKFIEVWNNSGLKYEN